MGENERRLGSEPFFHAGVRHSGCRFGVYTEIGENNTLENVDFGAYSYTGPNVIIQNTRLGRFANIAAAVRMGPTDHPMNRPTQHHFTYRRRLFGLADTDDQAFFAHRKGRMLEVGRDTWFGHGAIVLPDVQIGDGAVIGAGSVVTRDVPPYAIVVGNPAHIVRYRFEQEVINRLQEVAWWDWPHSKLKECLDDFSLPVEAFLEKHS